jgi:hypothetical protein
MYYLFSLYEYENIGKWSNKLIGDIFSAIKNKLQFKHTNKWDYFVEDFLAHYIKVEIQMTKKDFEHCEKNFSKFMKGKDLLDQFIDKIIDQLSQKIELKKIKKENWDDCIAIRLKPFENDYPDIVLRLNYDNTFSLNIYYNNRSGKNTPEEPFPKPLKVAKEGRKRG